MALLTQSLFFTLAEVRDALASPVPMEVSHVAATHPPPTRIVRVWLIANTLFRGQEGRCEYGAIELQMGENVVIVN